jgi:hypothetical protein
MGDGQMSYRAFLATKAVTAAPRGLDRAPELAPHLFPFQRHCVDFALRVGSAGLFLDTGLGKTECELEFCQRAMEATNLTPLIWTPLAVAGQTALRAEKWGYAAKVIRDQSEARPGIINICNYDRRELIDASAFSIVAFDEASIFKSFAGKNARALIEAFRHARFKLPATATPAPNDHMELGQYAELLGILSPQEMLSRWFINDTSTASQEWRLKGHAIEDFWNWMASWARMAEKPSDLGDSDEGFVLPPFDVRRHKARDSRVDSDLSDMFGAPSMSATSMHDVKRQTSEARADAVAALIDAEPHDLRIIWCDTDYEATAIKNAVPSAVEIRGSMSIDEKEEKLAAFSAGQITHLLSKPSICGFGLDWSHCARMVFVGRSYSYETFYQAVRRCWRFGQKRKVVVDLIVAEGEDTIGRVIDRKAGDHASMKAAMRAAMLRALGKSSAAKVTYNPTYNGRLPRWLSAA